MNVEPVLVICESCFRSNTAGLPVGTRWEWSGDFAEACRECGGPSHGRVMLPTTWTEEQIKAAFVRQFGAGRDAENLAGFWDDFRRKLMGLPLDNGDVT